MHLDGKDCKAIKVLNEHGEVIVCIKDNDITSTNGYRVEVERPIVERPIEEK